MTDQGKPTTEHDRLADRLAKAEAALDAAGPAIKFYESLKTAESLSPGEFLKRLGVDLGAIVDDRAAKKGD